MILDNPNNRRDEPATREKALEIPPSHHDTEAWTFAAPVKKHRPCCYITAACLEARDIAEEEACYEVMLFRLFVNEYEEKLGEGAEIADYRKRSAEVARVIEHHPARREIYLSIYERAISPLIDLIVYGRWEEAHDAFESMRTEIENRVLKEPLASPKTPVRPDGKDCPRGL
ncbi:MAG: hypothetical protein WA982_13060 [Rubrobacteraceae bacterium]